jgi:hypothetical protein
MSGIVSSGAVTAAGLTEAFVTANRRPSLGKA